MNAICLLNRPRRVSGKCPAAPVCESVERRADPALISAARSGAGVVLRIGVGVLLCIAVRPLPHTVRVKASAVPAAAVKTVRFILGLYGRVTVTPPENGES